MDRREFFKKGAAAAGVAGLTLMLGKTGVWAAESTKNQETAVSGETSVLAAVKGGEPDVMFDQAIEALGGMKKFVKKGQTVLIKPNMSWDCAPDSGANTHPALVKRIVEQCLAAGAAKVYVMDHNIDREACETSGVRAAAEEAGAIFAVVKGVPSMFEEVEIPSAKILKNTRVLKMVKECDVFINVPVMKNHGGTRLTMGLKNLMGCVEDRRYYHSNGVDQCVADFPLFRKPDLNIMDAYRVMTKGGPSGKRRAESIMPKMLFASTDIVALDAVGEIQSIAWKMVKPNQVGYIPLAHAAGLGESDLKKIKIIKLSV
ncbi:MAG: DUF362 domain-containing protein [Victivallaceae bacterium]|nr:DUF362 domain-containing protein [Victivallaceae bacterium]